MKTAFSFLLALCLCLAGCGETKQPKEKAKREMPSMGDIPVWNVADNNDAIEKPAEQSPGSNFHAEAQEVLTRIDAELRAEELDRTQDTAERAQNHQEDKKPANKPEKETPSQSDKQPAKRLTLGEKVIGKKYQYSPPNTVGLKRTIFFMADGMMQVSNAPTFKPRPEKGQWKIVGKEIHAEIESGIIAVFSINADGDLTEIAKIGYGEREEVPKEEQVTWSVMPITPFSDVPLKSAFLPPLPDVSQLVRIDPLPLPPDAPPSITEQTQGMTERIAKYVQDYVNAGGKGDDISIEKWVEKLKLNPIQTEDFTRRVKGLQVLK